MRRPANDIHECKIWSSNSGDTKMYKFLPSAFIWEFNEIRYRKVFLKFVTDFNVDKNNNNNNNNNCRWMKTGISAPLSNVTKIFVRSIPLRPSVLAKVVERYETHLMPKGFPPPSHKYCVSHDKQALLTLCILFLTCRPVCSSRQYLPNTRDDYRHTFF